jgi:hypothetical protein
MMAMMIWKEKESTLIRNDCLVIGAKRNVHVVIWINNDISETIENQ